jgi:hypothetical protein
VLDAVFRIDDLGETDPVALVDEHHFAAGDRPTSTETVTATFWISSSWTDVSTPGSPFEMLLVAGSFMLPMLLLS